MQHSDFSCIETETVNQLLTEPVKGVCWGTEASEHCPAFVPFRERACSNEYPTDARGMNITTKAVVTGLVLSARTLWELG